MSTELAIPTVDLADLRSHDDAAVGRAVRALAEGFGSYGLVYTLQAPLTPGYTRVALAHFVHIHAHRVLYPLEPFRSTAKIRAYSPPVLAGTYGTKTLVDIGLAPPAALDQLGYRHTDRLGAMRDAEA